MRENIGFVPQDLSAAPLEVIEVDDAQSWIEGRKDLLERAALVRRNNPGS
jgi:hypothetical protein